MPDFTEERLIKVEKTYDAVIQLQKIMEEKNNVCDKCIDGLARKNNELEDRVGSLETASAVNQEQHIDLMKLKKRVSNLERWQSKLVGIGVGVSLTFGALGSWLYMTLSDLFSH